MLYKAIGLMSGSSLDGLDIAYVEFQEEAGKWRYEIVEAECCSYPEEWISKLQQAINMSARDYQLLHTAYGHYTGRMVNQFIEKYQLQYKVSLIASHGHTTFHMPEEKMTAQLGEGAAIAAVTQLPVVSDLRALDVAFGGQGAPIVPIGEKLLLSGYDFFLNLGGIANLSLNTDPYVAFDICPANRVLNLLANELGKDFDEDGNMAAGGAVNELLLGKLNSLDYYGLPYPKSLANDFGTDVVFPLIKQAGISVPDALRTYTEHIIAQTVKAINTSEKYKQMTAGLKLFVSGGGALNSFLVRRMSAELSASGIEVVVPDIKLVNFKEAVIMAFIGVLRWRQEYNVLSSVTGAARDSIGGALWTGQEA
jgi:anhydro-N-acetylmuramic acid kinase